MKRSISLLSLALAAMATGCESSSHTPATVRHGSFTGGGYTYGNVRGYGPAPALTPLPPLTVNPAAVGTPPTAAAFTGPSTVPYSTTQRDVGLLTLPPTDPFADLSDIAIEMGPLEVPPDSAPAYGSGAILADAGVSTQEAPATSQITVCPGVAQVATTPTILYEPVYTPVYYPVYVEQPTFVYVEPQYGFYSVYPVYQTIFIEHRREICRGVIVHEHDDRRGNGRGDGRGGPHDPPRNPPALMTLPDTARIAVSKSNTILPPPKNIVSVPLPVPASTPTKAATRGPLAIPSGAASATPRVQASKSPNRAVTPLTPEPPAVRTAASDTPTAPSKTRVLPSAKGAAANMTPAPKPTVSVIAPPPKADKADAVSIPRSDSVAAPKAKGTPAPAARKPDAGDAPAKIPALPKVDPPKPAAAPATVDVPAPTRVAPRPSPVAMPDPVIKSPPVIRPPDPVVRAAPDPIRVTPAPADDTARGSNRPGKLPSPDTDGKKK